MNFRKIDRLKYLYLLCILSSSLFYAYATIKLVAVNLTSPFLILLFSTCIDIFVFLDLIFFKKLCQFSSRYVSLVTITILLVGHGLLLFKNVNQTYMLLIFYIICSLAFALLLIAFEQKIVSSEKSVKAGLLSITLLRNLSKIFGFSLGSLGYSLGLKSYNFILIASFLLFMSINIDPELKTGQVMKDSRHMQRKFYLFLLASLSVTAVFWIPPFVVELNNSGLIKYSSFIFMAPGITAILYLKWLQDKLFVNNFKGKNIVYIILLLLLLILNLLQWSFLIRFILFNLIIALGISISIEIRFIFMEENNKFGNRMNLQIINLVSSLALLIFTILAIYFKGIPNVVLILNAFGALFLKKGADRGV